MHLPAIGRALQRARKLQSLKAFLLGVNLLFIDDGIRYYHTKHLPTFELGSVLAESGKTLLDDESISPWY
jgi:hypothetical protein